MDTGFVALVWDKQPNAGTAGFSTIYDTSASPIGLNFKQVSTSKDRFVILWQDDWICQNSGPGNSKASCNKKHYNLPDKFLQEFSGSGSTLTSGALLPAQQQYRRIHGLASIQFNHDLLSLMSNPKGLIMFHSNLNAPQHN